MISKSQGGGGLPALFRGISQSAEIGESIFRIAGDHWVGPTKQRGQTSICGNSQELPSTKVELR